MSRPARVSPPLLALIASMAAAVGVLVQPSEAPGQYKLSRPESSASAPASASAAPVSMLPSHAPDPSPLVTRKKWVYEIVWHDGAVFVPTPTKLERSRPTQTPRAMGRFAIELYVGRTLVERVRFELPGLDGDPFSGQTKRPRDASPDMERRMRFKAKVEVPDSDRATYAVLIDRATGHRLRIPWPPIDTPPVP